MKASIDINDFLYSQLAVASEAAGTTVELYLQSIIAKAVERDVSPGNPQPATQAELDQSALEWWKSFDKVDAAEAREVQAIVDEEFSQVRPEDWE